MMASDYHTMPSPNGPLTTSTPFKKVPSCGVLGVERQLMFDDEERRALTPHCLNTMRKEGHLCDGVLEVGSRSFAVHRAVLACCSTFFMEQFACGSRTLRDEDMSRVKLQHLKLGGLDYHSVEVLINYAYTARLECEAEQVKSVYKAAALFKMHSAAEACSRFLADNLKIQNCLGTRSFANSCGDQELALKSSIFIQEYLQAVLERSPELPRIPTVVVDIVGVEPANLSQGGDKSLCKLVVDWMESVADDKSVELLAENPHVLYLSTDNNLHDCLDELADVEINNCDIVKDYKKLGKRKMMTPLRGSKDKVTGARIIRSPSNPSFTNGDSSSCESLLSVVGEWSVVATKVMGDKSFMCLSVLNDVLACITIKFRPQPPSGTIGTNEVQHVVVVNGVHTSGSTTKKKKVPTATLR